MIIVNSDSYRCYFYASEKLVISAATEATEATATNEMAMGSYPSRQ